MISNIPTLKREKSASIKYDCYCAFRAEGKGVGESFELAFGESNSSKASKLESLPGTPEKIAEIREAYIRDVIFSKVDSANILAGIAKSVEQETRDRISATKELNSMLGYQQAKKLEVNSRVEYKPLDINSFYIDSTAIVVEDDNYLEFIAEWDDQD